MSLSSFSGALKYIHSLGIVHRDLKPENILCEEGLENIRIADFGLSQLVAPTQSLQLACGTLSYVAPEILLEQGYSTPADIWSLGIIAYLVLRGKLPYTAEDQEETMANIKECKNMIRRTDKYWRARSPECCDLLKQMLHKSPGTRLTAHGILQHPWSRRMALEVEREKVQATHQESVPSSGVAAPASSTDVQKEAETSGVQKAN